MPINKFNLPAEMLLNSENIIHVIGISGENIGDNVHHLFKTAHLVCGSHLQLETAERITGHTFSKKQKITPLKETWKRIEQVISEGDVVVLASGDPMFFGVGRAILKKFGHERVKIYPNVSYMQLAFSRFGLSWDSSHWLSFHGREMSDFTQNIADNEKLCLFTDKENSPIKIIELIKKKYPVNLLPYLEILVASELGTRQEKLLRIRVDKDQQIDDIKHPNLVIIHNKYQGSSVKTSPLFGLKEKEIAHSRGLITKNEVRAAAIHALRLPETGVVWDIGGGSGSVSVEMARFAKKLQIFCVERKPEELDNIEKNIQIFNLTNVHKIAGEAPVSLSDLPAPDRIFVGGSGGNLKQILDHGCSVLQGGGIIVVNSVLEQTAKDAPKLMHDNGFKVEISRISVTRSSYPEGEETEFNPISIITGYKE